MPNYISIPTKNGELKLNSQTVRQLLYSQEIRGVLTTMGNDFVKRLGNGYGVTLFSGHDRVRAIVTTTDEESANDNLDNNTLLKAVGK